MRTEKKCEHCGNGFYDSPRTSGQIYCSKKCGRQAYHIKNKAKIVAKAAVWNKAHPKETAARCKEYKRTHKLTKVERVKHALRTRVNDVLNGRLKGGSAIKDLGCTAQELIKHLESKFYPNPRTGEPMTWENHGRNGWHIDHIEPLAKHDLTDPIQFKLACHYKNLQPLWWFDNLDKRDKN